MFEFKINHPIHGNIDTRLTDNQYQWYSGYHCTTDNITLIAPRQSGKSILMASIICNLPSSSVIGYVSSNRMQFVDFKSILDTMASKNKITYGTEFKRRYTHVFIDDIDYIKENRVVDCLKNLRYSNPKIMMTMSNDLNVTNLYPMIQSEYLLHESFIKM